MNELIAQEIERAAFDMSVWMNRILYRHDRELPFLSSYGYTAPGVVKKTYWRVWAWIHSWSCCGGCGE